VAGATAVPVFAIGGVMVDSARELCRRGCHGVAVVGAIANAADPRTETRRFLDAITYESAMT
jgi:thiamine-phosphate pyrophosphorylase